MRRLAVLVASLVATLSLGLGAVASAASVSGAPAECTSHYTKKVVLDHYGSYYRGTSANELVVVTAKAGGSYVNTAGGNDCVVLEAGGNAVNAGSGNDVVVANAGRNALNGSTGSDKIYSNATGDALNGGKGTDTCQYDNWSSSARSCEQ